MVNLLILSVTVLSGLLHIFFARLSDRVGRKPVMLFGLGFAVITLIPGFQWLTEAVNPALVRGNCACAGHCLRSACRMFPAI